MKSLYIFSLFLFAFGLSGRGAKLETYGTTSWSIKELNSERISIVNRGTSKVASLYVAQDEEKPWYVALATNHFLVDNNYESLGVRVSVYARKPFTLTGRSMSEFIDYAKYDSHLEFAESTEAVVNWMIPKELVEVSIEEMGGTSQTFTFDTHGLKEVMLEAQRRQRALK